jgi:hypothetical protein
VDPIRPVTRELPAVPPVRRQELDEEAERREQQRRRGRHDQSAPQDEPDPGDEGGGPLIDVRA